jgi:hypothetical protein
MVVCLLAVLLVVVMTGSFNTACADGPSNGDEPNPVTPITPDGSSTGDAWLLLDLLLGVGTAILL